MNRVKVTLKTHQKIVMHTLNKGEKVVTVAWKNGLEEKGFGACGGNCCCATCHVVVEKGADTVTPINPMEKAMLDTQPNVEEGSRLACQMVAKKEGHLVVHWQAEEDSHG